MTWFYAIGSCYFIVVVVVVELTIFHLTSSRKLMFDFVVSNWNKLQPLAIYKANTTAAATEIMMMMMMASNERNLNEFSILKNLMWICRERDLTCDILHLHTNIHSSRRFTILRKPKNFTVKQFVSYLLYSIYRYSIFPFIYHIHIIFCIWCISTMKNIFKSKSTKICKTNAHTKLNDKIQVQL